MLNRLRSRPRLTRDETFKSSSSSSRTKKKSKTDADDAPPPPPPPKTTTLPHDILHTILVHHASLTDLWLRTRLLDRKWRHRAEAHARTAILPHTTVQFGRLTPVALPFDTLDRRGAVARFYLRGHEPRGKVVHFALAGVARVLDQTEDYAREIETWADALEDYAPVCVAFGAGVDVEGVGAAGEGVGAKGERFKDASVKMEEIRGDQGTFAVYRARGLVEEPVPDTASVLLDWRLLFSDVVGLEAFVARAVEATGSRRVVEDIVETAHRESYDSEAARMKIKAVARLLDEHVKQAKLDVFRTRRFRRIVHADCLSHARARWSAADLPRDGLKDLLALFHDTLTNPKAGTLKHRRFQSMLGPWRVARRNVPADSAMAMGSWGRAEIDWNGNGGLVPD